MSFVNTKLEEFNSYLDGKRVAVIGLGVSNIPLIEYLHEVGAETVVLIQSLWIKLFVMTWNIALDQIT